MKDIKDITSNRTSNRTSNKIIQTSETHRKPWEIYLIILILSLTVCLLIKTIISVQIPLNQYINPSSNILRLGHFNHHCDYLNMFINTSGTIYFINSYGISVFYTVFLYIQMIILLSDKSMMSKEDKMNNIKPTIEMIALIILLDYLGRKGYLNIVSLQSSTSNISDDTGISSWIFQFILVNLIYIWIFIINNKIVYKATSTEQNILATLLAFSTAGTLGNMLEQWFRGGVIDYLNVPSIASKASYIFNIEDILCKIGRTGILIMIVYLIFKYIDIISKADDNKQRENEDIISKQMIKENEDIQKE